MPNTVVKMPQLGESVVEGTIGRWLKQPGDRVERDEPLVEIQTDKVNAEVPSPVAGILQQILLPEGTTVSVRTDMAIIGDEVSVDSQPPTSDVTADATADLPASNSPTPSALQPAIDPPPVPESLSEPAPPTFSYDTSGGGDGVVGHRGDDEDNRTDGPNPEPATAKRFYTPVVLRMAGEHGLDLTTLQGTGAHGRVTRRDVERAIAQPGSATESRSATTPRPAVELPDGGSAPSDAAGSSPAPAPPALSAGSARPAPTTPPDAGVAAARQSSAPAPPGPSAGSAATPRRGVEPLDAVSASARQSPAPAPRAPSASPGGPAPATLPDLRPGGADEQRALTPMRRAIADHMTRARAEIPDAWSLVEIDVTRLVRQRESLQAEWQAREGYELTYLPFFIKAVLSGLRAVPELNATYTAEHITLHRQCNLGIAVSVEQGLVVPVLRDADQLSVAGIAASLRAIVQRARAGKLGLDDLQGATFTVNNPGSLGSIMSQPIVPLGQAGIITMEAIVKRPVVTADDAIAVRSMMNSCLSFDHRVLDGAGALKFLQTLKQQLETVELPLY